MRANGAANLGAQLRSFWAGHCSIASRSLVGTKRLRWELLRSTHMCLSARGDEGAKASATTSISPTG